MDARLSSDWVVSKVSETFDVPPETVQDAVREHEDEIKAFWLNNGSQILTWFYQVQSDKGANNSAKELFIADLVVEKPRSKALVFIRTSAKNESSSTSNAGVLCLELLPSMVDAFLGGLGGLLASSSSTATPQLPPEETKQEQRQTFLPVLRQPDPRFLMTSGEELVIAALSADSPAAIHLSGILEDWCTKIESVLTTNQLGNKDHCENSYTLETEMERCRQRAIHLGQLVKESHDTGAAAVCQVAAAFAPALLKRWRKAETRLEEEVLHSEESVAVLTKLTPALRHLLVTSSTAVNMSPTPSSSATSATAAPLPPSSSPASSSLEEIQHALPRAFQKLRAAATASQVYSDLKYLGHLLGVLSGALAQRCKDSVAAGSVKLWDQPKPELISTLTAILELYAAFERQCKDLLTVLADNNSSNGGNNEKVFQKQQQEILQAAMNDATSTFIFVAKRASRLRVLFTAVERFTFLSKQAAHIAGVPAIVAAFFELAAGLRKGSASSADLLDPSYSAASTTAPTQESNKQQNSQLVDVFERDMLDFQVHVNDLELALQDALRAAFENAVSTEHALGLLRQHAPLLPPDVVDSEVDFMFSAAFQRFAADLEVVESHYEKYKTDPPLPRGTTPIAGSIQWSRSLLRRIERPMRQFAAHEPLISAKESKKTIKLYNRLAQTFLEFEGLLHAAWVKSAESAVALMHVPVLVQHPNTLQLHVNLDSAVSRVLTEGAWVGRMGLPLPDKVRKAMLAGDSLKSHHGALAAAVAALAGAQARLPSALKPLGQAMTRGVLCRAEPGMSTVFWTSATLDGFIHLFTQAVHRFCQVVQRIENIHVHRVEAAAHAVAKMQFMALHSTSSSTGSSCSDFVKAQEVHLRQQSEVLLHKDAEARAGCEEIIHLVAKELQQNGLHIDSKACEQYRSVCAQLLREAANEAAEKSVAALITRLNPTEKQKKQQNGSFLYLELRVDVPAVAAHPSLEKVKVALASCASNVLAVIEIVPASWSTTGISDSKTSAEEKDAKVKASRGEPRLGSVASGPLPRRPSGSKVPGSSTSSSTPSIKTTTTTTTTTNALKSLSDAVETMRGAVDTHIRAFQPFNFLWTSDKEQAYASFMQGAPSLEESEGQLRNLVTLQTELEAIPPTLSIFGHGSTAVVLTTDPFKHAVRAEIADWKAQFAQRLQARALSQLQDLHSRSRDLESRLARKIEDIQDVEAVVQALKEAREEEIDIERRRSALEEIYSLLTRYGVRVPKEETDALGDLSRSQKLVKHAAAEAAQNVAASQTTLVQSVRLLSSSLKQESAKFRACWETTGPIVAGLAPTDAASRLYKFKDEFEGYKEKWKRVVAGETLFGLPKTPLPGLEKTQEEILLLEQLYGWYTAVITAVQERGAMPWTAASTKLEAISTQISEFSSAGKKMPKSLRDWPAYKDCRHILDDFTGLLPLLEGLSHPAVRERHWKDLAAIAGPSVSFPLVSEGLTLGDLLAAGLMAHREEVEDLCAAAVKEDALERKLKAVTDQWASEVFTFVEHKQRGPVVLKPAETAELLERLEDSIMSLGGMSASRYAAPLRQDLQTLSGKLGAVGEAMEHWLAVQSMWTYMEVVFSGGDIVRQLPAEAKRFQNIDRSYIKMVTQARENGGKVLETCAGSDALRTLLPHLLEQLELCQKSLSAYLETKRSEFPRFYFVSDPTLLEILSLGSDPAAVVPHFQSGLFDSLSNVTFDAGDKYKITEMWSREGEKVTLTKPVDARGPVEVWLQRLVTGMQDTMRDLIRETAYDVREDGQEGRNEDFNLAEFLFNRPAQVALLGLQLKWTGETLAALQAASRDEKGALSRALKRSEATLRDLVALALRDDLTKLQRTALETCITVYIHQKEATEELVRKRVKDPRDFEWLKQCRLTWRDDRDSVIISICDVDLEYSYEYLGVKERLVITPLTDVCYITLTQALGMFLGGAPAGPAGTGKTETTKDLGATLGKYVVVFNCSDQMDYKGMGKIFKGLAQSGLWGCFDEFNRINLDVLSVCAQQISCVLGAVRERRKSFVFTDGSTVPLDPRVGFFITMNPGYAGRQELPENLKALFRGVTMMVPNRQTIMKVKLAAAGFQESEVLAKKFNVLYSLCEQQLSKQPHYDFGLRNILSVLRTAGASKRANPEMEESELIMRTLRDMNMSKFVAEDVPLFLALIDDLFPGQKALKAPAADVAKALQKVCTDRGLKPHQSWLNKCIQLYETSLVRHGIMVVGPPGSGKSSAVDCLAAALTELGQKTVVWRMNPKSITAPQMFGRMDAATGDWTDGVFATLWRRAARAPKGQNTWIVLDGPVDAVWIENLNTVLDDNKVLTLANGDRVLMTQHMRLIFEPENLNNASPATVSRAGIIYMASTELGWDPVVQSWLQARPEREAALLKPCFDRFVAPVLEFVKLKCAPVMATEAVCLVGTLLTLLTGIFGNHNTADSSSALSQQYKENSTSDKDGSTGSGGSSSSSRGDTLPPRRRRDSTASFISNATNSSGDTAGSSTGVIVDPVAMILYERQFLYCLIWSLGGLLTPQDRVKLDTFLRTLTDQAPPQGSGDTIYEYFADETSGEWHHWATKVPKWKMPVASAGGGGGGSTNSSRGSGNVGAGSISPARRGPRFTQMIVPTLDSVRYERLLSLAHAAGKASVLVGGPGTAKTTTVQQFLSRFDPDTHISKTITFSSLTNPALFQASLENCVEKRQGRTFGPPGGKKSTIFLDDLSMPAVNTWGDQVTSELVRQVLEQGGWYSTAKPVGELKQLTDVSFVAAMNLPGAGRNDIPNRLKRHFCIFHMPAPNEASITGVFGQLVAGHFTPGSCSPTVVTAAPRLVPATIHLWNAAQGKLLPTPAKLHYSFTLRDMSKVFQGIMLASMEGMQGVQIINGKEESGGSGAATSSGDTTQLSGEGLLVSLWAHECRRVFSDKLIAPEEKSWVDSAIQEAANQHFGKKISASVTACTAGAVFADFLRDAPLDEGTGEPSGPRPSCYEAVPGGLAQIRSRVEALVAAARESARPGEAPPNLVLFDDALSHVLRISRVLSMDRGSALLVGVGGSGKQSLARLAAYLAGATCFKIMLTKTYGVPNLLEDLKTLYKTAAFKPNPVAFLITESDIKDESFLEYINQVLSTGEVAGLFPREELDAVLNDIRPLMRATEPGVPDTWDNLYSFFINRVRDRLHLVLCVSPVGPSFARWAQQFPGLINGCTVDWFLPWPQEALLSVSSKLLGASSDLALLPTENLSALQNLMSWVHTRVTKACQQYHLQYRRAAHVTPKSFISALQGFHQMYSSKLAHLRNTMARLEAGLNKMTSAKEDVGKMRTELAGKDKQLVIAGAEAERLLAEISASTAAAEKERSKVSIIVEAVRKKASEIAAVKADAERDLEAAKPALEAALAALNSITQKDIVSLKALKSPPDIVKRIFDCVLLLRHFPVGKVAWQDVKGSKVIVGSYEEAVRMMGDMNFLQSLLNFPKEAINDETVELLQPYFAAPDFNFESAKKASGNVAGLCNWAAAMCRYHEVAKAVEPKIIALHAAEAELKIAESERAAAESELAVVQAALDAMQLKLEAAISHKAGLEADAAATRRKMENAATLMGALGGEETRWIEQNAALHAAEHRLIGDCALACAFLSYLGPFNRAYREQLMDEIFTFCKDMQLPFTQDLDVSPFLVEDTEAGQWAVEGLPTDPLSIQNGVLVTRASRWPLLVDPQGQGRAWLARREGSFGLKIVQPTDGNFQNILEDCLTLGKPILIENVEESLDPALDSILERQFVKKGKSLIVMLGDKEVEVEPGFKIFLACRLPRPRFSPEIFAKVTVIDFTVTPSGLEDQLLGALVLREKRDLEEQRRRLVEEVASYRCRVAQLESDLLTRLSTSSGNLLDDTELVDVLAMTKLTATEVAAKMVSATETRRRITLACEEYRPAAHRAMLLYFVVSDLAGVNCMYQTSLAQFTALYEDSIDSSERPPSAAARVAAIASHFTAALFEYIQRGLYERHKLVFVFMIANKVAVSAGKVTLTEVETFLKLGAGADLAPAGSGSGGGMKRKPKEWIPTTVWRNILLLADRLPGIFGQLPEAVAKADSAWAAWYDLEAPETVAPPHYSTNGSSTSALGGNDKAEREVEEGAGKESASTTTTSLSPFQKLCLVRAFREDRALVAAGQFVATSLGPRFVEPPPTNLEKVWAASAPKCPIVCLLSSGADPTKSIEDLAKRKKIKCFGVSMGQGQEIVARRLVAAAAAEGHWVLLQNAHLGLKYLSEVEHYLAKLGENTCHESFRLWITCEPHPDVPIGLLHVSLKVTNEAPVGIRAGLRASYQWLTQDILDAVARPEWRTLLFALCFLHSVIQERRKFGPIGWNVPYEFNSSDLAACVQALQNHVADMAARRSPAPDWPTLRYMISSIQYGGRITDDRDRELMDAYTEKYFHEEVLNEGYALFLNTSAMSSKAGSSRTGSPTDISTTTTTVRGGGKLNTSTGAAINSNYVIPMGTEIDVYRKAIEALPAQDTPELFGLHANADLTFRALQVADAVAIIEGTMPKDGSAGSGGESREEGVDRIVEGLLTKLPARFNSEDTKEALKKLHGGATGPLNIHLRQEIERLNKVVAVVAETLKMLRLAIAGSIAMSDDVLASLEAVHAGRPPASWLKISWESPTLGSWFQGLLSRHEQLHTWLNSGRPKSFWLPGFFNPQGFLTAVKQEVTRKHAADGWALDDVVMVSEVTRLVDPAAVREGPNEGVYIHGLFLEGCSWNGKEGGKLVDAEPKKLFSPLPVMHVTAVQARDKRRTGYFEAPCYRVRRRTGATYVANFMLKTDESRTKWVLRGAALLFSID